MEEVWVPVISSRGYYMVSSLGTFQVSCDIAYNRSSRWANKGDLKYRKGDIVRPVVGEYYQI